MQKHKVIFFDESYVLSGAEKSMIQLIREMNKDLYDFSIVSKYQFQHHLFFASEAKHSYLVKRPKWWSGSDFWGKPLRGADLLNRFVIGFLLFLHLRAEKANTLHINLFSPKSFWVALAGKAVGARVIGHCRSDPDSWIPPKHLLNLADHIITVSDFIGTKVRKKGSSTPVQTIYNPIASAPASNKNDKMAARKKIGFNNDTVLFCSVGLLEEHKGHDTAINVAALLLKDHLQFHLYIVGGGNKNEENRLRNLVGERQLSEYVTFTGKQVENTNDYIAAADLILSLSKRGEAFGRVPFESAAMGKPSIAPSLPGGAAELLSNNATGILVDTNNTEIVANICKRFFTDPYHFKNIALAGRRVCQEKLAPDIIARKLEYIYKKSN